MDTYTVQVTQEVTLNGKTFYVGEHTVSRLEFDQLKNFGALHFDDAEIVEVEPTKVNPDIAKVVAILEKEGIDVETGKSMTIKELTSIKGIGEKLASKFLGN